MIRLHLGIKVPAWYPLWVIAGGLIGFLAASRVDYTPGVIGCPIIAATLLIYVLVMGHRQQRQGDGDILRRNIALLDTEERDQLITGRNL